MNHLGLLYRRENVNISRSKNNGGVGIPPAPETAEMAIPRSICDLLNLVVLLNLSVSIFLLTILHLIVSIIVIP